MIEADGVTVESGGVTLLAPVSLVVRHGDSLVVRGRNGAGKSTLLKVIAGTVRPSRGTVFFEGAPLDARDGRLRRSIAAMIGLPPMAPELTVFEHVLLVASTWFDEPAEAREVAERVIGDLALTHLQSRFPHELSSGQTQLFGLALVLARPFDVLVLDEPEQRLDAEHLATLTRVLRGLRDRGAALVIATHSDSLAANLAGRELHLDAA